jgi:hypothetical protein
MEAAGTSETSGNLHQTTRRHNLEDIHLHSRHRQNLKSYFREIVSRHAKDNGMRENCLSFPELYVFTLATAN